MVLEELFAIAAMRDPSISIIEVYIYSAINSTKQRKQTSTKEFQIT